jgi:protein-tyrosine phosphatase
MTLASETLDPLHPDRHLPLPGTRNLRDVGGYPAADGRRTRWRTLLRTDSLDLLPPASQSTLIELGLRQVIDLRWPTELEQAPSVFSVSPRVRYRSIPLIAHEGDDPTPHVGLPGLYRFLIDERAPQLIDVVRAVSEPGGVPAVIGCAAGKDRTGVAIALILSAVGVPNDVVVRDYALSEGYFARPNEDPHLVDWRSGSVEAESPPEYMEAILAHLDARYGGAAGLLRSNGLTEGELSRLLEALTEPSADAPGAGDREHE